MRSLAKSSEARRQEAITAYLDDALSSRERRRFEQRLATDSALRTDVEQQRLVKSNLQRLPRVRAPRYFTLDPAVYGRPERSLTLQLYPALRTATVLAAVVFVVLLAVDFTLISPGTLGGVAQAPQAEQAVESERDSVAVTRELEQEVAVDEAAEAELAAEVPAAEPALEEVVTETEAVAEESADLAEEPAGQIEAETLHIEATPDEQSLFAAPPEDLAEVTPEAETVEEAGEELKAPTGVPELGAEAAAAPTEQARPTVTPAPLAETPPDEAAAPPAAVETARVEAGPQETPAAAETEPLAPAFDIPVVRLVEAALGLLLLFLLALTLLLRARR